MNRETHNVEIVKIVPAFTNKVPGYRYILSVAVADTYVTSFACTHPFDV